MRVVAAGCAMVLGLMVAAVPAFAEGTAARDYALGQHGSLRLTVPLSWKDKVSQPPNGLPPTILFVPESGAAFKVLLTPIWSDRSGAQLPIASDVRKKVEQAAAQAKTQVLDPDVTVQEMTGSTGVGYHYAATDRTPTPGEYKRMDQGMLRVGDLLISFTILSQDASEPANRSALAMLEGAAHSTKQTAPQGHAARPDELQIKIGRAHV